MSETKRGQLLQLLLFCLVFFFCAWFFSPGSWAQISRMDMILAGADHGTFRIDRYLTDISANFNTGDWSRSPDGHYYSNKAPGQGLLGIPVLAVLRVITGVCGIAPSAKVNMASFWIVNLAVSALPTALAAVFLFRLLMLLGHSRTRSLFFAAAGMIASPVFLYSTSLYGHSLAASFLIFALYAYEKQSGKKCVFFSGFWTGFAVLTDYLALPAAFFFLLYVFWKDRKSVLSFTGGSMFPALLYLWYHWTCFGNPFLPATFYNNPIFTQNENSGSAFSFPSTMKMLKLLIGSQRGLLFAFPLFITAIPGGIAMWKQDTKTRHLLFLMISWVLSGLLINGSFNGWHGGSCIGPRYLIYSMPAWILCASYCPMKTLPMRSFLILSAAFSFFNAVVTQFSTVLIPTIYMNPFMSIVYRFFASGIFLKSSTENTLEGQLTVTPFFFIGVQDSRIQFIFLLFVLLVFMLLMDRTGEGCVVSTLKKMQDDAVSLFGRKRDFSFSFNGIIIGIGLFFLLLLPGNIPFVFDEPILIARASAANIQNVWRHCGLVGSLGHTYGPIPAWFYQILLLLTRDLVFIAVIKTFVLGVGCVILLHLIEKETGKREFLLPALALASPWFWHYSRVLWDNVFLIFFSAWILYSLIRYLKTEKNVWGISAFLTVIAAVWTHSMALPFAGGMVLFFLFIRRELLYKHFKTLIPAAVVSALLLLWILIPKLLSSLVPGVKNSIGKLSFLSGLREGCRCFDTILRPGFRFAYLPEYEKYGVLSGSFLSILEYASFAAALLLFLAGIFFLVRNCRRKSLADQAAWFSFFIILAHIAMAGYLRIPYYRHYNTMPILVPGLVLLAYGAWELGLRCRRTGKTAERILLVCSLAVTAVCIITIDLNGGDDTPHYGPTLSNQMRVAEKIYQVAPNRRIAILWKCPPKTPKFLPFSITTCLQLKQTERPGKTELPRGYGYLSSLIWTGEKYSGFTDVECVPVLLSKP